MKRLSSYLTVALLLVELLGVDAFGRGFGGFRGGGGFGGGGFGGFRGGGGFDRGGGGFDRGGFGGGGFDRGGFGGGGFDRGGSGGGGFDRGGFGGGGFGGGDFSRGGWGGGGGAGRSDVGGFGQRGFSGYRGDDAGAWSRGAGAGNRFGNGNWGGSVNRGQLNNFLGLPSDAGRSLGNGALENRGIGSGQALSNYGTHPYSQTWAHSQGQNLQNWANNHPNWSSWANNHNWAWTPTGVDAAAWGTALWAGAAWPYVGDWLGWDDPTSYGYDYGDNITYQDGTVYYGSRPTASADEYYQEASDLAGNSAAPSSDAQWLPLGVFALAEGKESKPSITFQLAIDKKGVLRGNAIAEGSTTVLPIKGAVQKSTQRVCWTVGTNTTTVYDTGLYNLTKSESPILVHDGAKKTKQELLVRMKQPAQSTGGSSGPVTTAN